MSEQRLCIVCHRAELEVSERQTCIRCLGRTRSWLTDIKRWYPLLAREIVGRSGASRFPLGGSRDDPEPALPGGDVLVMSAPAVDRGSEDSRNDPMPVTWLLCQWEDDWRSRLQLASAHIMSAVESATWLDGRLSWAAQHHPAFDEFHDEIRDLQRELGAVTGQADLIDRGAKIPCPDCGQPLIRHYADPDPCSHGGEHREQGCDQGGRRDDWRCSSRPCGRTVTEREYWFAVAAHSYEQQLQAS